MSPITHHISHMCTHHGPVLHGQRQLPTAPHRAPHRDIHRVVDLAVEGLDGGIRGQVAFRDEAWPAFWMATDIDDRYGMVWY